MVVGGQPVQVRTTSCLTTNKLPSIPRRHRIRRQILAYQTPQFHRNDHRQYIQFMRRIGILFLLPLLISRHHACHAHSLIRYGVQRSSVAQTADVVNLKGKWSSWSGHWTANFFSPARAYGSHYKCKLPLSRIVVIFFITKMGTHPAFLKSEGTFLIPGICAHVSSQNMRDSARRSTRMTEQDCLSDHPRTAYTNTLICSCDLDLDPMTLI